MDVSPIPASSHTICQYVAFLARSLKFTSINNYINIIALLHKEFSLTNPLTDNWAIKSLLTGINVLREVLLSRSCQLPFIFYWVFSILLTFTTVLMLLSGLFA